MQLQDKEITEFWNWFTENNSNLQSDTYDPALLKTLDEIISNWKLNWEIGPGKTKENSLTISPKGDKDLLALTEHIINNAPNLENWEFYPTKQPKENWHLLELPNHNISIDAKDWKYVLLKYEDGKIEILIKADNLIDYDKDTKELIADIVLTNLLGEKIYMEKIAYFDIVEDFESKKAITEIKYLPDHLRRENGI